MENSLLNLEKVSAGYGKKIVLKNVSFELCKGEILSVIGPNGEGKSTLLKTIGRQIALLGGSVSLLQKPIRAFSSLDFAKNVSVLLTRSALPEYMTCRDVVASARYPYTGCLGTLSASDEKIVEECIELLGLEKFAKVKFCEASDGQRQRVMIARAICQQPDLLLLDEPFSFLDINHKLHLLNVLRKLSAKGVSIIMSVHEIDFALKISDRILCVSNKTTSIKRPEELYSSEEFQKLYSLDEKEFDSYLGISELSAPVGEPKVFVLSDSGRGISFYRRLAKKGLPFAAGILFENDIDFPYANMMASKVFSCKAFEKIGAGPLQEAKRCIDSCEHVIDAGVSPGEINAPVRELLKYSEAKLWHIQ